MMKTTKKTFEDPCKRTLSQLARRSRAGLVEVGMAASVLGLGRHDTAMLLARLERKGWLKRVRRSLYLVLPIESASGESTTVEDPWILAQALYSPCYIGGWSATEHWGLTEQIFHSTFVVTGAHVRARKQRILNTEFNLVRVAKPDLDGTIPVWRGREQVAVSNREKTIADALKSPDWVGGMRHLMEILTTYGRGSQRDLARILYYLRGVRRGAGAKRFGFLVETLWPKEKAVIESAMLGKTTGLVRLDPDVKAKGKLNKRWNLWVNVPISNSNCSV
jgi:predicted transcriptional regulator of viral defense system